MTLTFRRAVAGDAAVIADFNCRLALETENRVLQLETVRNGVLRGLQQGDEVQYWLAESITESDTGTKTGQAQIVGQVMLTREWSDWRDGWIVWLQSVYVIAESRRNGVFRSLFQYAAEQLREQCDIVALRLYVEHQNEKAMQTYFRLGFRDTGYVVMEYPTSANIPAASPDPQQSASIRST